jgi:hypothetical protein
MRRGLRPGRSAITLRISTSRVMRPCCDYHRACTVLGLYARVQEKFPPKIENAVRLKALLSARCNLGPIQNLAFVV